MNTNRHSNNSVAMRLLKLAAVISILASAQPLAQAQSGTWNATSSGLWSNTANWQSGTVADGSGNTATFSANLTSDVTVGLDSARTIQTLSFSDTNTATPGSWILGNNGNAANTLTMNGTNPTITVNALGTGSTATVSLQLSGTQGIRKTGSGTLVLTNGANNFSGGLLGGSANWGTIRVADSTVYGAGNQSITSTIMGTAGASLTASGGTLELRYNGQNDTTAQTLSMAAASGALTLGGSPTTINVDRESGTGTNKTIAMGNFITTGSGTLNVTGSNGYNLRIGGNVVLNNGNNPIFNPTTANLTIAGAWSGFGSANRTVTLDGTSAGNGISGNITNSGGGGAVLSLVKSNSSTWVLGGNNTYAGTTSVNAGTLLINGSTSASSAVTVAAGATLGGNGTIGGATTINGILAPGNSIGQLNITANTTWAGAATAGATTDWKFELGAANSSDLLNITGDFLKDTAAGSVFRFDFLGSSATGTFKLIDWSGSTGFSASDFSYNIGSLGGGNTGTFAFNGSQLEITVIPEPSTWALLAGSLTALVAFRRRRH